MVFTEGERSSYLVGLCNKYGDFKVAKGFVRGDKKTFTKRKNVLELWQSDEGMKFLGVANCRQILNSEIILDMDEDASEKRMNDICDELDSYGFLYKAYFSGSKGYHIHILENALIKYSHVSRQKIRGFLISKFKCDPHMASDNVLIALEDTEHFKTGQPKTLLRESR